MGFFDSEEEESVGNNWQKQIEREKRERELFMDSSAGVYEIPDKLEPREAIWYYNVMEDRRNEVYELHLSRLSRLEDWLEIYTNSKEETPARELAYRKISKLDMNIRGWIGLYEARAHDERMVELSIKRLETACQGQFEGWLEVYDYAPYSSYLQQVATRRLRLYAKDPEHWQALYDRSDIGSAQQTNALQEIMILGRLPMVKRPNKQEAEAQSLNHAASRGPKEWMVQYGENDIHAPASDDAVLNIYLSADLKKPPGGSGR